MWYDPMTTWLLKSPLHGLISSNTMLVSAQGRKSGKTISTPTNYLRIGNTLWIISWRNRTWWKNLRGRARARLLLAGQQLDGLGQVLEDTQAVGQALFEYYRRVPRIAKYVKIGLDASRQPIMADCERAAKDMVVVKIDVG